MRLVHCGICEIGLLDWSLERVRWAAATQDEVMTMKRLCVLLSLCHGNHQSTVDAPRKGREMQSFDIFFVAVEQTVKLKMICNVMMPMWWQCINAGRVPLCSLRHRPHLCWRAGRAVRWPEPRCPPTRGCQTRWPLWTLGNWRRTSLEGDRTQEVM